MDNDSQDLMPSIVYGGFHKGGVPKMAVDTVKSHLEIDDLAVALF